MLYQSAHALKMDLTITREEVKKAISETVRKNNMMDRGYLRIQITRGIMRKPFMNPSLAEGKSSLIIFLDPGSISNDEEGARIITSSIRRSPPDVLDQKIHSCNKLNSLLAKLQANIFGVDEALMLDENGFVAECSATNIFFIKDGKVLTSHANSCKLGVTRQTILEKVKELGYEAIEKDISLYEVYNSDECFYCGTHGGITPVIEVDGRKIGDRKIGSITRKIMKWYSDTVEKESIPI
jgi:branched-chain amino acid aminotransferase